MEADLRKKLLVINLLFVISLSIVGFFYKTDVTLFKDFKVFDYLI